MLFLTSSNRRPGLALAVLKAGEDVPDKMWLHPQTTLTSAGMRNASLLCYDLRCKCTLSLVSAQLRVPHRKGFPLLQSLHVRNLTLREIRVLPVSLAFAHSFNPLIPLHPSSFATSGPLPASRQTAKDLSLLPPSSSFPLLHTLCHPLPPTAGCRTSNLTARTQSLAHLRFSLHRPGREGCRQPCGCCSGALRSDLVPLPRLHLCRRRCRHRGRRGRVRSAASWPLRASPTAARYPVEGVQADPGRQIYGLLHAWQGGCTGCKEGEGRRNHSDATQYGRADMWSIA